MGRIKGTVIKRTTKELLKKYPGLFSEKFEDNKKPAGIYVKQKKFRNSISGYIARILKRRRKEEEKK